MKQSSHTRVENMLNSLLSTCDRKIVTERLIHILNDDQLSDQVRGSGEVIENMQCISERMSKVQGGS